ncbi:MAG: hypothetical protein CEN88_253 [Candidatus Berkelbacteria bacterium Licking1014_2]|uniref:Uncharacterized protein n=1 Tax=Candidatus Berkelbacteria bacterium Licking1014_2 TaxID=2017146 RepID=A0A554LVN0_9BACT|nr:MAG: hypothetical protein CEN88_253 [Candidatus Berkelbacteria bacterium Licking1014_2]
MIFEIVKFKFILAIVSLVLISGSSLTAAALELKDGSVSKFIANIGSKDAKDVKIASIDKAVEQQEVSAQPAPAPAATTPSVGKKTTKTSDGGSSGSETSAVSDTSGSSSSDSSSGSSGGSSDSGSSGNSDSGDSSDDTPDTPSTPTTPSNIYGNYSATSVESIISALELVLDDALGDYSEPGGGGPPGGVYDYAPIDQDDWYMGVRDGRLYIKLTLGGTIPTSQQTENDNKILSVVYNIGIDSDSDLNDSCGGAETHLQINIAYHDNGQIWYNPWFNANCLSSGATEHDSVYEKTGTGTAHTYNSGIGKNSIVWSYALSDLAGTISVGSTLRLDISSEAEGSVYHHYSYDQNHDFNNRPVWIDWTVKEI